jgi:hypothetical protein
MLQSGTAERPRDAVSVFSGTARPGRCGMVDRRRGMAHRRGHDMEARMSTRNTYLALAFALALALALAASLGLMGSVALAQTPEVGAGLARPHNDIDPQIEQALRGAKKGDRLRAGTASAARTAGTAQQPALFYGWNQFFVSSCIGITINGVDYLYMYFTDGSVAATSDSIAIAASGGICIDSAYVFLYITYISGTFFLFDETFIPHN